MKTSYRIYWTATALVGLGLVFTVSSTALANDAPKRLKLGKAKMAGPDLMIQDDALDVGAEPYNISTPWLSPSIWVSTSPAAGYVPTPFSGAEPAWVVASKAASTSAEYRSPLYSTPNYVYVKVKNVGTSASSGTERLKVYWSSASTGLNWPMSWVDNVQTVGGAPVLFGQEMTKPRRNATSVSAAERNEYRDALLAIAATQHPLAPGTGTYWQQQQEVHLSSKFPDTAFRSYAHGLPAFAPWHREMMNRYEAMLQETSPKVKLLYWDWSASGSAAAIAGFPNFIGTGSGTVGLPLFPSLNPQAGSVSRAITSATGPADAPLFAAGVTSYNLFQPLLEGNGRHNSMHGVIGPTMADPATSPKDPFFFFLHTNVDRLWAQWQRQNLAPRTDAATAYGTSSGNYHIVNNMGPWADPWYLAGSAATPQPSVSPWTAGSYAIDKTALDRSVLSPPFYDTAPLTIPVLQPGQEVVLEIPWYPPNPAAFGVSNPEHVCLLARVETAASAPFGMTVAETNNIGFNTAQNNNVAWRNISVVDNFAGASKAASVLVRNPTRRTLIAGLSLQAQPFVGQGMIRVDLGKELFARWQDGGAQGENVEAVQGTTSVRTKGPNARIRNLALKPDEGFAVPVVFELDREYDAKTKNRLIVDLRQFTTEPDGKDVVVGGQRFELDVRKIRVVPRGAEWRFIDGARVDGSEWTTLRFRDDKWATRKVELGFGERPRPGQAPNLRGENAKRLTRTLFRKTFDVEDPSFFRSLHLQLKYADGAAAFLNGKEVFRDNLNDGAGAGKPRVGLIGNVFNVVALDRSLLVEGRNVLAVEVRRAPRSEGMNFDAELVGNWANPSVGPSVRFSSMWDGRLIPLRAGAVIEAQAVAGSTPLTSVSFFVDNKLIKTVTKAPFTFPWKPTAGTRRLRVVAKDAANLEATDYANVLTLANVPPTVELLRPSPQSQFALSDTIEASATATDVDGTIRNVRFIAKDHARFDSPEIPVGVATKAPFTVKLSGLKTGSYMLWAVATDNGGERSFSNPTMIVVGRPDGH